MSALAELYSLHADRVWRIARNLLPELADAEDLVQEVFLKVFERAKQFRRQAKVSTWLYRVTVNTCLHRLESESNRRVRLEDRADRLQPTASEDPSAISEREELRSEVRRILDDLDPTTRAMMLLRDVEELEYRQIAEVLGLPVSTVLSRVARTRRRLEQSAQVRRLKPPA